MIHPPSRGTCFDLEQRKPTSFSFDPRSLQLVFSRFSRSDEIPLENSQSPLSRRNKRIFSRDVVNKDWHAFSERAKIRNSVSYREKYRSSWILVSTTTPPSRNSRARFEIERTKEILARKRASRRDLASRLSRVLGGRVKDTATLSLLLVSFVIVLSFSSTSVEIDFTGSLSDSYEAAIPFSNPMEITVT